MIILQNLLETRHNYFITIIIADYSRNIYYFVLKTNITLLFPTNNNVTSTATQL